MLIGLVRHGETDWNAGGILQGQTDIPLNDIGLKQAAALAERLAAVDKIWDAVWSSDLSRARTTAEIIANRLQIPLAAADVRLRERFFGQIEGTTLQQREEKWGKEWRGLDLGAESDGDMRARGMAVIQELAESESGRNILIVSHGSFIAQLLQAMCADLEDQRLGNLSYNVLSMNEGKWETVLHNCTRHLDIVSQ